MFKCSNTANNMALGKFSIPRPKVLRNQSKQNINPYRASQDRDESCVPTLQ